MALASFALALLTLVPQGGEPKPILSSSEQSSLNKKAKKWFAANAEYERAPNKSRERAFLKAQKEKARFVKDWETKSKKGNLLASVVDLAVIFDKVFDYDNESGSGIPKLLRREGEIPERTVVVPKGYRAANKYRAVLLVPGHQPVVPGREPAGWVKGRDYWAQTWEKSKTHKDAQTLFHIPHIDDAIDLDPLPDFSKTGDDKKEFDRISSLLLAFGETQRSYRLDRERVVLDCGKGASGFGLRMAANFPDRFAGIILRWPVDVTGLRLGSLAGIPVVLISSADTAAACKKLKESLDGLQEGMCTIVEAAAGSDYPFKAEQPKLDAWITGVERNLFRKEVVLEPNDDRFRKGYWVEIGTADQIHSLPPDEQPRIDVVADRVANRITVKTRGIENFKLLLNDELVDLDKEFTVEINGKAFPEQRERNLNFMVELMGGSKFDTSFLFTTFFEAAVPKTEGDNGGENGGENGGGGGGDR